MKKALMVVAIMLLVVSGVPVMADSINVRPVAIGTSSEQALGGVGGIFDTIGADSYIDSYNTQSNAAIFTNAASGVSVASFIIAIAGSASGNVAGIYKYGDPSDLVPIFNGATSGPTSASIYFYADGSVQVAGVGSITPGTYAGFGDVFGFYLQSTVNGQRLTWYSEDSLNGGSPQALIYQGNGIDQVAAAGFDPGTFGKDHWIVAWENQQRLNGPADGDYNDLVYIVESITAVPEPGTLLLLGCGLVGLAGFARKRFKK